MGRSAVLAGCVIAALMSPQVLARGEAIINVPGDAETIQDAIDQAADGYEIVVAPGTYYELLNTDGKAVVVRSSGGPEVTTINGKGSGPMIFMGSGEGRDTVIEGFRFTGADGLIRGGGMRLSGSSPTIRECIFEANNVVKGGGIFAEFGAPLIIDCVFLDNEALQVGAGLAADSEAFLTVIGCAFTRNCVFQHGGAVSHRGGSTGTYVNCVFFDNRTELGPGGAFWLEAGSVAEIINCTLTMNEGAQGGGGAGHAEDSSLTMRNCISWGNCPNEVQGAGKFGITIEYTDIQGGFEGEGNMDFDPLFADVDAEDFRLVQDSPAIDIGRNDFVPLDEFDLDNDGNTNERLPIDRLGNLRFADDPDTDDMGFGSAPIVDLGAFEYPGPVLQPPSETPADGEAIAEATGDLDGNGTPDVIAVIPDLNPALPGRVQVFLNNGNDVDGTWLGLSAGQTYVVGPDPSDITIGRFDAGSTRDAVVSNAGDNTITVLLGVGDGTLSVSETIAVGTEPRAIAKGDWNLDGFMDLAVAATGDDVVELFFNTSASGQALGQSTLFGFGDSFSTDDQPVSIDPTDLDNDKDTDMVVANRGASTAKVAINNGGGLGFGEAGGGGGGFFTVLPSIDVGSAPVDVATADLDFNGFRDIIVANSGEDTLSIILNNGPPAPGGGGGGQFDAAFSRFVGPNPRAVDSADLDGDGDKDIAAIADAIDLGPLVQVLENQLADDESLTFQGPFSYPVDDEVANTSEPNSVETVDLNGDGVPDVVTSNGDSEDANAGSVSGLISQSECEGDTDGDGFAGWSDLTNILLQWGPCPADPAPCPTDLNDNGSVDMLDLMELLRAWGTFCAGNNTF